MGNLRAKRDWGYAPEYVEIMWKVLQQDNPTDLVVGTGEAHSVKKFLEAAFSYVDLNWKDYVRIDKRYFRPTEVERLIADPGSAREELNWNPKIKFGDLIKIMVDADMRRIGLKSIGEGDKILREKFPNRW